MSSITWLTDKVGVTENGAYVIIAKAFDPVGTEIEHKVAHDEASVAISAEKIREAIRRDPNVFRDLGVPVG